MSDKFDLTKYTNNQEEETIISDRTKLDIGYIPQEILHREHIIDDLLENTFAKLVTGKQGDHCMMVGPPGTGKTATMKHVLQEVRNKNNTTKFQTIYINCTEHSSAQAVYEIICKELDLEYVRGTGLSKNIQKVMEHLNQEHTKDLLVILDEIHCLHSNRSDRNYLSRPILYSLSRPHEAVDNVGKNEFEGNITFIGISNDAEILEHIDSDVKSSSDFTTYRFPRYTEKEIIDILSERQRQAYSKVILSKPAIKKIAREIAQSFDGDIRKGISILKSIPKDIESPSVVIDDEKKQIEIVDETIERIQKDKIQQVFYSKSNHFYLVMAALYQQLETGKSHLKYITQSYSKACEHAGLEKKGDSYESRKSFVYRQLESLVDIGLLEKTKDYSEPKNPNCYEEIFNLKIFNESVEDNLKREGLLGRIQDQDLTQDSQEQKAVREANGVLEQHMSG